MVGVVGLWEEGTTTLTRVFCFCLFFSGIYLHRQWKLILLPHSQSQSRCQCFPSSSASFSSHPPSSSCPSRGWRRPGSRGRAGRRRNPSPYERQPAPKSGGGKKQKTKTESKVFLKLFRADDELHPMRERWLLTITGKIMAATVDLRIQRRARHRPWMKVKRWMRLWGTCRR